MYGFFPTENQQGLLIVPWLTQLQTPGCRWLVYHLLMLSCPSQRPSFRVSLVLEARSAIDCVLHPTFCHRLAADPATQQQKLRISPGLCGCPAAIVWTPSAICFRRLVPPPKGPTALIPFHHEAVGTTEEMQETRTSLSLPLDAPSHSGGLVSHAGCPFYITLYTSISWALAP